MRILEKYSRGDFLKKNWCVSILTMFFLTLANVSVVYGVEEKDEKVECERKKDIRNKEFNELVMDDIFSSFGHKYEEIIDQSMYLNMIDLMKYTVLTNKKDAHLESLKEHLTGEAIGEKRIYFFHGDPNTAYIFFKGIDNQNTAVYLKKNEEQWNALDKQVKKGKKIENIRETCKDDYFMKRMFNNLYPE